MTVIFIFLAAFIIFYMNKLMEEFCRQREFSGEQQRKIFRTANIVTMILLVSSYIELLFT